MNRAPRSFFPHTYHSQSSYSIIVDTNLSLSYSLYTIAVHEHRSRDHGDTTVPSQSRTRGEVG